MGESMESNIVRYETSGRIATLTLNRPHRLNAISGDMPWSGRGRRQ